MRDIDFRGFVASLSPEEVEIIEGDLDSAIAVRQKIKAPAKLELAELFSTAAFTFSLEMIGLYHRWLMRQLSETE